MNTTNYENIWQASLIHVTDEFSLPPVVLQAGEAIIGTLGNFSVSTGKAKAKKTFNVSAIVAAALINGQVLEYKASFPESKRTILYFDTEQSLYHCQLVIQRILRLAGLPIDREPEYLKFSHLRGIARGPQRVYCLHRGRAECADCLCVCWSRPRANDYTRQLLSSHHNDIIAIPRQDNTLACRGIAISLCH